MHRIRIIILGALLALLLPALAAADIKDLNLGDIERLVAQKPELGQYLLIDARPEIKYAEGFIPWAISIPKAELKERLAELPADKANRLVFYCGGIKCKLSAEAADIAAAAGYSNVSTFSGGIPAWQNAGHTPWVSAQYIKMVLNDPQRVALVIDARPPLKYNAGTIPGALNLPFQQFATLKGLLPADQNTQLIFFCGGYQCDLSHKSATAARALGYSNVVTFAGGWPAWKEASKRAFALVDPNNMNGTAPATETVRIEGEIDAGRFLTLVRNPSDRVLLVDVRPADEYLRGHLPGAINILEDQVGEHAERFQDFAQVVFYCNTGSKAAMAYYEAEALGLKEKACFLNKTVMIEADGSYTVK
jgi:rhodanese-related sulfurtransferase